MYYFSGKLDSSPTSGDATKTNVSRKLDMSSVWDVLPEDLRLGLEKLKTESVQVCSIMADLFKKNGRFVWLTFFLNTDSRCGKRTSKSDGNGLLEDAQSSPFYLHVPGHSLDGNIYRMLQYDCERTGSPRCRCALICKLD